MTGVERKDLRYFRSLLLAASHRLPYTVTPTAFARILIASRK